MVDLCEEACYSEPPSHMEVVVVGAGVFGAWTALSLSKAGHQVTVVDHQGPANSRSSSTGESRIIRSAYGADEIYTVMARRCLQLWTDFLREENRLDCFLKTGVLWMAQAEEASIWQAKAIFERLGIGSGCGEGAIWRNTHARPLASYDSGHRPARHRPGTCCSWVRRLISWSAIV